MRIYSATDVGQKRKMNQDYVFASEGPVGNLPNLFTVADGMGGHNAGDYASSHAVRILVDEIREDADYNPVKVIRHAIEAANTEIRNRAQEDENLRGMGTTMVVATIVDQYAYVANVGDSRLYVIQDGIRQVTRDHSLVQEMVRMGEISEAEARNHPDKNIITRALGAEKTVDVDFFDLKLEKGCTILMCSDGLSNMVEDEKIQELAESIMQNGLLQPIVVREYEGKYQIVVGERRYRACKLAGITEVPCIIQELDDNQTANAALVENIQRENLSAIEEALAYQQILDTQGLTQAQLAEKVGKKQSTVANKLRLLKLPMTVQESVKKKEISERHARALLKLEDTAQQNNMLKEILEQNLTVDETEKRIAKLLTPKKEKPRVRKFSRSVKIAINTINQAVKMVTDAGTDVEENIDETDDEVIITLKVKK